MVSREGEEGKSCIQGSLGHPPFSLVVLIVYLDIPPTPAVCALNQSRCCLHPGPGLAPKPKSLESLGRPTSETGLELMLVL